MDSSVCTLGLGSAVSTHEKEGEGERTDPVGVGELHAVF